MHEVLTYGLLPSCPALLFVPRCGKRRKKWKGWMDMAEQTQQAQVVSVRQLCPLVRELILLPLEWKVSFKPGQWVSLHLPVGQRPPLLRAYSMAEPESTTGQIMLAFDRVPRGLGSGYLFTLQEGDKVVMAGPYGRFVLPEHLTQDLLLIARYTGIVPVHCIIKHLFASEPSLKVTLVYSGPNPQELIYHDEFAELALRHPGFHYVPVLLGSDVHAEEDYKPVLETIDSLIGRRKDFLPMICGVKSFVHPLRTYFTGLGFVRKEIRYEIYD
jgi:ferredoxin-NADP reductase